MTFIKKSLWLMLMVSVLDACIEPYDPPVDDADVNLLVVDGFLDASKGTVEVILMKTLPIKSEERVPFVSGATVWLEDEEGQFVQLTQTGEGLYVASSLDINLQSRYRLMIQLNQTTPVKEYISEFVELTQTPPIDSIVFYRENDGLRFAVDSHDPRGESKYFRWTYEETYEYNANYNSTLMFEGEVVVERPSHLSINTCWKTNVSTNILIGSTNHLTQSRVSRAPITLVPNLSLKLSVKYSLLVRQQALTEEAYNYWLNLEKSTENLGGLFDPLPSEVRGNFSSTTDPGEKVIGYFSGGTVEEARIYVNRYDLPEGINGYSGNPFCELDTLLLRDLPDADKAFTYLVNGIYPPGGFLIGYFTSTKACVDCRTMGGTTTRPDFWE